MLGCLVSLQLVPQKKKKNLFLLFLVLPVCGLQMVCRNDFFKFSLLN